jgi:outer membrane protein TolC
MKKLPFAFLFFCLFLFWGKSENAFAQERLTLQDAITKALQHNFDIQAADVDAQTSQANNTLGNAGFLPDISAKGTYNYSITDAKNLFSNGTSQVRKGAVSKGYSGGVNATMRVFAAGRAYIVKRQLNTLQSLQEDQLKLQIQTTVSQVIQAYAQVVYQHQQTLAIDTGLSLAKTRMVLSQMQYESGLAAKVNFLQARVDYNARQADSLNLVVATNGIFADLNLLMGEDPEKTYIVDDSLTLNTVLHPAQKEWLQQQNLSISIAKKTWEASRLNEKATRANQYPTLDINLGYNYNNTQSQAGFSYLNQSNGPAGSAVLNIPIFQAGDLKRLTKIASLQTMRDEILYAKQNSEIARQYRRAWTNYQISVAAFNLEKQNINFAKENLDIQKARFRVGVATSIETREAESSYVEALVRLYNAAYNVKIGETKVLELENNLVK